MKILHVVHCIDTEGPMRETVEATFDRIKNVFGIALTPSRITLKQIQNMELDLKGQESAIARMIAPDLLKYNEDWNQIDNMLDEALSAKFRNEMIGFDGNGWVYSWHCLDHVGYKDNPRHKDIGYGNIFRHYRNRLIDTNSGVDELNWHFHPVALNRSAKSAATSYTNSYSELNQIICRRVIDDTWFPVVNRPGFHAERPDSHAFLEQWLPFDYANQSYEEGDGDQPDIVNGRFGDWRRAPYTWRGYRPHHDDYQSIGSCRRTIFRCLNVGTRVRLLTEKHVTQAFDEARNAGVAILAFANHDYRDIRLDVRKVRAMLKGVMGNYPDVNIKFSGAESAAKSIVGFSEIDAPKLSIVLNGNVLQVKSLGGDIFGPQPYLAIKTLTGSYMHDNMDFQIPFREWTYTFDDQTIPLDGISAISAASAGRKGGYSIASLEIKRGS